MIYNSISFIILFPLIFLLYYVIPARHNKVRNIYLLCVSYLLYIQWEPVYAIILMGVTLITFYSALIIPKSKHPKQILTFGVILTLFPLLFFKYFNFINEIIRNALSVIGLNFHLQGMNWAIPIGISFYTFQALGYLWDVYYKRQEAESDLLIYALFISFFPSILSGPINKASLVIPQLKKLRTFFDYSKAVEGLKIILWGMFMKVVVADRLALYVDTVLPNYENYTGLSCLTASILYTIQIYADFAGYSLMAIGVGKTLGFELTENFCRPYFATSITDFWHRWHISLSTWLKDYIYIPMGGSRCSKARNYWNIFVTFAVSGIWHGANWTFIVWGCIHGVCQILEKMFGFHKCNTGFFGKSARIIVTFMLVNFAWLFFRMPTLTDACNVIGRIIDPAQPMSVYIDLIPNLPFSIIGILFLLLKDMRDEFFPGRLKLMDSTLLIVRWGTYLLLMIMILSMGVLSSDQFIYANF
ncbi:MAG: MBOAT family protein [Bacteroidaceae bacterium]|nr:MBOAT family protein [Bacteroidaceae bacterium]